MQQSYLRWIQAASILPPLSLYPDELTFVPASFLAEEGALDVQASPSGV